MKIFRLSDIPSATKINARIVTLGWSDRDSVIHKHDFPIENFRGRGIKAQKILLNEGADVADRRAWEGVISNINTQYARVNMLRCPNCQLSSTAREWLLVQGKWTCGNCWAKQGDKVNG